MDMPELPDKLYRVTYSNIAVDENGLLVPHLQQNVPFLSRRANSRSLPLAYEADWDLAARIVKNPGVPFLDEKDSKFSLLTVDTGQVNIVGYRNNRWLTHPEIFAEVPEEAIIEKQNYVWVVRETLKSFPDALPFLNRAFYRITGLYEPALIQSVEYI